MQGHKAFEATNARAAYVERGGSRRAAGGIVGVGVVIEGGDLVLLQLDDGGVDADGGEEALHDVAHAARRAAEDDHRILGDEALDAHDRGLADVDGQRWDGGRSQFQADAALS